MTPEEVGEIWHSLAQPSIGKVHRICQEKGFKIGLTTISRYRDRKFKPFPPKPVKLSSGEMAAKKATNEIIRRLPDKIMREFHERVFNVEDLRDKKTNAKKAMCDGYSSAWFSFLRQADNILKKSPMAYATIITAFGDGFQKIVDSRVEDVAISITNAKDITPQGQEELDRELRELLAGP